MYESMASRFPANQLSEIPITSPEGELSFELLNFKYFSYQHHHRHQHYRDKSLLRRISRKTWTMPRLELKEHLWITKDQTFVIG